MPQVQLFLSQRHPGSYRVYNLCSERSYDPANFNGRGTVPVCIRNLSSSASTLEHVCMHACMLYCLRLRLRLRAPLNVLVLDKFARRVLTSLIDQLNVILSTITTAPHSRSSMTFARTRRVFLPNSSSMHLPVPTSSEQRSVQLSYHYRKSCHSLVRSVTFMSLVVSSSNDWLTVVASHYQATLCPTV
jgi:hypothetical protein